MYNMKEKESCRDIFKNEQIFTVVSLYIYRFILFIKNKIIKCNSDIHTYNTRGKFNLH